MHRIIHGDCLHIMHQLINEWVVVDAIITDPPYWTTKCKWDQIIEFDKMRPLLEKLIKYDGAIVLFGNEPFSSSLRMSNLPMYRYDWKRKKTRNSNPFLAKKQPLRHIEDVMVFAKKWPVYYPIMEDWDEYIVSSKSWGRIASDKKQHKEWFEWYKQSGRYPKNIIKIANPSISGIKHPTQKPIELMEYFVKTYTKKWDIVLDFTAWSWSTGVACKNTWRNCILIEKEKDYVDIIKKRMQDADNLFSTT